MAKIYSFFADGMEEIEALTPVDLLRRAGHDVETVSIMGRTGIRGAHNIYIEADSLFEDETFEDGDLFILPGGGEGTKNLNAHEGVRELIKQKAGEEKHIAAICAAPMVLGHLGLLEGKDAVIYPGMEDELIGARPAGIPAVTDGKITTGRGPGASFDFALELIRVLDGDNKAEEIRNQVVYK